MQKRSCEKRARAGVCVRWMALAALALVLAAVPRCATAQMNTTTVQGTIYRADGTAASGTVLISWRAFITPQNQAVAAGSLSATIGANGFLSVNLTPNTGALPAGSYYTAVYHLSDGTVNQEYWVVPASGTATVASVRAQLEPSTVAAQPAVTEAYVQSAISSMGGGYLPLTGGTLSGPLTLSGDPVSANQAATKHYADSLSGMGLPMGGGSLTGPLTAPQINGVYTVDGVVYPLQQEIAWAFSLPGAWTAVDPTTVDFAADTGELVFPLNIFGLPYNEVEVTYTAGLATLPDAVVCACAQIVKNAQSTPGLNVKSSKVDTLQLQYFSGSLVDPVVQALLKPWVAVRMG